MKRNRPRPPFLALPGIAWLAAFFLVAFYAIIAVGLGNITDLYEPIPHWNPLDWNVGYIWQAITDVVPGGRTWGVFIRTLLYIVVAVVLALAIGCPPSQSPPWINSRSSDRAFRTSAA